MGTNTLRLKSTPRSGGTTKKPLVPSRGNKQNEVVVVPAPGSVRKTPPMKAPFPRRGPPPKPKESKEPELITPAKVPDQEELLRRAKAIREAKVKEETESAIRAEELRLREEERERKAQAHRDYLQREKERREEQETERKKEEERLFTEKKKAEQEVAGEESKPKASPTPEVRKKRRVKDKSPVDDRGRITEKRRESKVNVNTVLLRDEEDELEHQPSHAAFRRREERRKRKAQAPEPMREKIVREVQLPETIMVQELANRMTQRVSDVILSLMNLGVMATQNQTIDADTAEIIIEEFGHKALRVSDADVEDVIDAIDDNPEDLKSRYPVVAVMGHVDHGKTTLLDTIRKANVATGEDGGITQHIGAYQVITEEGETLTFLDTPGHAAFTSMRERGANVTDIVVLVVAADDSVMPQTIEAINHAKAAEVPLIVAINKCDLSNANPDKVRNELLQHGVVVEKHSGEVLDVEISAVKHEGISDLLKTILLQAELLELKANPNRPAAGTVIEAKLDIGRGPVATVLIQKGTLQRGDIFVVGEQWGKVRALINDQDKRINSAGPSMPVEVLGLNGTPHAGDTFNVVASESQAREISEYRRSTSKNVSSAAGAVLSLENLLSLGEKKHTKDLQLVVKADVQGSAEAINQALAKIGNEEVQVRVLHFGVGAITETDVSLAGSSGAHIIGFNVRATPSARSIATQKGMEFRYYSIIYRLVDDIKALASGLLDVRIKEHYLGNAEILETFKITGVGLVAGCKVTEGIVRRSSGVRLLRDNVVIHEGKLKTLKRFQNEVDEVQTGLECGMAFENYANLKQGDYIEVFEEEEIQQTL